MPVVESIVTSIAASVAYDLLNAGNNWLTAKTVGSVQERALQRAFDLGFQAVLRKLGSDGLSQAEVSLVGEVLQEYVQRPEVAKAFLDVAVAGESPDLSKLTDKFEQLGRQDKLQGIKFDVNRNVVTLLDRVTTAVLTEASQPNSPLFNLVLVNRVAVNKKTLHQYEQLITKQPQAAQSIYHSCFISYATPDLPFAEQLHTDLTTEGVNCWFAPQDLKVGDKLLQAIHKAIMGYDKLLVILSEHSINSQWVEDELGLAFDREHRRNEYILFPIRLDDTALLTERYWAVKVRQRFIGDFTQVDNRDTYQKSLSRLLRDLRKAVA